MSTKDEILSKLARQTFTRYDMPEIKLDAITYPDKITQFAEISKFVGGNASIMQEGEDINALITSFYPNARQIASNLPYIDIANINPDEADDPHALSHIDLSIIEGEIGVAENGCVWIPQQVRQKVIYFIAEYLVIVLDRDKLVSNMHEAYRLVRGKNYGFGVFISGPSKTADIEQALVVGAHGAKGVTVVLR